MIEPENKMLRFLLLGPIVGAVAAASITCGAFIVWVMFKEPDFYFRGWFEVPYTFILGCLTGFFTGIIYGVLLITFEVITHRTVRVLWFVSTLVLITFMASILVAYIEIKAFVEVGTLRQIPAWWVVLLNIVICCVFGPLLSKRNTPDLSMQENSVAIGVAAN